MQRRRIHDVAALARVRGCGQFNGLAILSGQIQRHIVRIAGREDERRAVDRQHSELLPAQ